MFGLLGSLFSGGMNLLGNLFSSNTSAQNTQAQISGQEQMQASSEQFNAQQADLNRQFQTQMSNTAYQRASADMKAAGLNPMMMFGSGSSASTPSGSTASIGTPTMPTPQRTSPLGKLGEVANSMVSSAISAKTFDKLTEEIANLRAEKDAIVARTGLTTAETGTEGERQRLVGSEADRTGFGVTTAQAEAERAKRYINMPSWYKDAVEYTKYGASGVESIGDAATSFAPSARFFKDLWRDRVDRGY